MDRFVTKRRRLFDLAERSDEVRRDLGRPTVSLANSRLSGKSLKLLPPDVIFEGENAPNSISAPVGGAYSAPPDSLAGFEGAYF